MKYTDFVAGVQRRSGLDIEQAEQASHSFFEMLGVFMEEKEAKHLASKLPVELRETLRGTARNNPSSEADGFFEHIGRNQLIGHHYSQAVWRTLTDCISKSLAKRTLDELPDEIARTLV